MDVERIVYKIEKNVWLKAKLAMSRRLYISVWNPVPVVSILLYTIQFDHIPSDIVERMVEIMECDFLDPLLEQKVVRLNKTINSMKLYFGDVITIDLAVHWRKYDSGKNMESEKTIINMKHPVIAFDLVDNDQFTKVFMNEKAVIQRLKEILK